MLSYLYELLHASDFVLFKFCLRFVFCAHTSKQTILCVLFIYYCYFFFVSHIVSIRSYFFLLSKNLFLFIFFCCVRKIHAFLSTCLAPISFSGIPCCRHHQLTVLVFFCFIWLAQTNVCARIHNT